MAKQNSQDDTERAGVPGADRAVVDLEKLRGYCLNPLHPRGKHKARLFQTKLNLTIRHCEVLRDRLIKAVREESARRGKSDRYGERYVVDFEMERARMVAWVRSSWIVRQEEDFPRLVTCYVLLD